MIIQIDHSGSPSLVLDRRNQHQRLDLGDMRQRQNPRAVDLLILRHVARDHVQPHIDPAQKRLDRRSLRAPRRAAAMNSSKARGLVLSSVKRKRHLDLIAQRAPVDHRLPSPGSPPPSRSRSSRRHSVAGVTPARSARSARASAGSARWWRRMRRSVSSSCMKNSPISTISRMIIRRKFVISSNNARQHRPKTPYAAAHQPTKERAKCASITIVTATST